MRPQLALAASSGSSRPSPVSAMILEPSTRLAMLRILVERALATRAAAWQWIRHGARLISRTPKWVGHAVLGVLGSDAGYETAVSLVTRSARTVGKAFDIAIRGAGRTIAIAAGAVAATVAKAAPRWGGKLVEAHADAVDATIRVYATLQSRIGEKGQRLEQLAHGAMARAMTTRAAAIASAVLALHVITRGMLATKVLHAAPAVTGAVAAATNPWLLLLAVAMVTTGAITWQALRAGDIPTLSGPLTVNIQRDGSVVVTGLPDQLSQADKQQAAKDATSQAVRQMEQTLRRRTNGRGRTVRSGGREG